MWVEIISSTIFNTGAVPAATAPAPAPEVGGLLASIESGSEAAAEEVELLIPAAVLETLSSIKTATAVSAFTK